MRLLGIVLDEIITQDNSVKTIYKFLKNNNRSVKLILYKKDIEDIKLAKFVKENEKILTDLGTKITVDLTESCYFFITSKYDIPNYTMKFNGDLKTGLTRLNELLATVNDREKHIR